MSTKSDNNELAKQVRSRVCASATDSAIFNFFSALDTPRSLACWLLYSNNEHRQLSDLEVHPRHYESAERFRDDYVATCFLSKADFLTLEVSKKEAAMAKFFKYEEQCRQTNARFRNLSLDPSFNGSNAALLSMMQRKIEKILGEFSPEEFVESANWGPGVSTLMKGEEVSATNKFQCETGITRDLYSLVSEWFPLAYPLCSSHLRTNRVNGANDDGFVYQAGNVIVTVPKNSKTDRVIAIEPGWNLWFQKGLGTMIRRRLARYGVDLNSQDKNQQFAHEAAFDGHLATVDFSSASDSIARALVEEIIPRPWLTLLAATRSVVGREGSRVIKWEKFSSMGNGFTFELESLIFFAAALAVCDYAGVSSADVSVFGDDVIIPSSLFAPFSKFCAFLGFTVNPQKSFSDGYFRESCGAHYFGALDCKPLYLKGKIHNVQGLYKLANGIRALAHRYGFNRSCDSRFRAPWVSLYKRVPRRLRLGIPFGVGDGGFVMNFDETAPPKNRRETSTWEGYDVLMVVETGKTRPCEYPGLLMDLVRGGQERARGNSFVLRGRTRLSVKKVFVHT